MKLDMVLTTIFVVLKLTHVIAWSWWWVLSPLWIGIAIAIVAYALIGIAAGKLLR